MDPEPVQRGQKFVARLAAEKRTDEDLDYLAGCVADLEAAGYGSLKCVVPLTNGDGSPMRKPKRPALAVDRVRWVGDPVAVVVARTAAEARDAAELVAVDIDPLPAVTDAESGAAEGAQDL